MDELYDKLWIAYFDTVKGCRSRQCVEYQMHVESHLMSLLSKIRSRCLAPTAEAFINQKPQPREIFALNIDYRIIQHVYDNEIRD